MSGQGRLQELVHIQSIGLEADWTLEDTINTGRSLLHVGQQQLFLDHITPCEGEDDAF